MKWCNNFLNIPIRLSHGEIYRNYLQIEEAKERKLKRELCRSVESMAEAALPRHLEAQAGFLKALTLIK